MMVNPFGNGITLAQNHTLRGLNVEATLGAGIFGNFGTLTVREMHILGAGQALDLSNGTLDAIFDFLFVTNISGLGGIKLSNVGGSLTVTGTTAIVGNVGGTGIEILSSPPGASFDFGVTAIDKSTTSGIGVSLVANPAALVTFNDLAIATLNGAGLIANNTGSLFIVGIKSIP